MSDGTGLRNFKGVGVNFLAMLSSPFL